MTKILAVCLGNICRSPAAEAAIREAAAEAGVDVEVDSAGTGTYHLGEPPHPRVRRAGQTVGLQIDGRARQVAISDFDAFDVIVAMDGSNLDDLLRIAPTPEAAAKVHLFRSFDAGAGEHEVPDPYYGTDEDYRMVIDIVRPAAQGLIAAIRDGRL
jgi:protein-tyrosine phosphatase